MDHPPNHPVDLFMADNKAAIKEAALVLSALAIDYHVERRHSGWAIVVHFEDQAKAHQQLEQYWRENLPSPEQAVPAKIIDNGWFGVVGYLAAIWFIPAMSGFYDVDFKSLGRLDAALVTDGQWWRAMTALTLHADMAHIASNSLFGCVFGLFVGRYLGSGIGWLLVLICGFIANSLNAWIQPESFRALGASTATFAALGMVPAFAWRRGYFKGRGWKRGFAPIFGAIALLAYTGFGSDNVDVLGHVFGFFSGLTCGLLVARTNILTLTLADQKRAGIACLLLLSSAWFFALS